MTIYHSTKPAPYVYVCTHKETKCFYIGYRERNVKRNIVSQLDFPNYRTSNKKIKHSLNEYDWEIVAEFMSGDDAYDFEQQLIYENWDNPLLINKQCFYKKRRFKSVSGLKHSEKAKQLISMKNKGRITSDETKKKLSKSLTGKIMSEEQKQAISIRNKGKPGLAGEKNPMYGKRGKLNPMYGIPMTDEVKQKISEANKGKQKGRPAHNKGKPQSAETKEKIRIAMTGRIISEHTRNLISSARRGVPSKIVICPHCNLSGGISNMKRWHFDNCRFKTI